MKELAESVLYDPKTGEFTWKISSPRRKAGDKAGGKSGGGYILIGFQKQVFSAHRLAWFIMTGEIPEYIDHIDGNRSNNAWDNLRNVTKQDNHRNMKQNSRNTTGITGVFPYGDGRFRACITLNRTNIHLGCFDTIEEAADARKKAEIKYGFHANHGRTN